MMKKDKTNWLENLIDFYDFIWKYGLEAHGSCINSELMDDFQGGRRRFEEMKSLILKKFPSEEIAKQNFERSK